MPAHTTAEVKLAIDLKGQAICEGRNDAVTLSQCLERAKALLRRDTRQKGAAAIR